MPFLTQSLPQNIAEKILKSKSKPKPLPAPNDSPSNTTLGPAGTEDSSAIQELMKPLQVANLKTWIDLHNISTTLKNKKGTCSISSVLSMCCNVNDFPYAIDLVKFIIDNPTLPIPSAEEMFETIASVSNYYYCFMQLYSLSL